MGSQVWTRLLCALVYPLVYALRILSDCAELETWKEELHRMLIVQNHQKEEGAVNIKMVDTGVCI